MKLRKNLADLLTNRITFIEIYKKKIDGKRVLFLQIPSSLGVVVMFNDIAYGRDDKSLVGLNFEKMNHIQYRNNDWSEELIDRGEAHLNPKMNPGVI